jgi:hypothetical protein
LRAPTPDPHRAARLRIVDAVEYRQRPDPHLAGASAETRREAQRQAPAPHPAALRARHPAGRRQRRIGALGWTTAEIVTSRLRRPSLVGMLALEEHPRRVAALAWATGVLDEQPYARWRVRADLHLALVGAAQAAGVPREEVARAEAPDRGKGAQTGGSGGQSTPGVSGQGRGAGSHR